MDLNVIRLVLLASCVWGVHSVQIVNFTVPAFVENGTEEFVLLECHYVYNETDEQLVVKWFHNQDSIPISQWIPEKSVIVTNKFGARVKTNCEDEDGNNVTECSIFVYMPRPTVEMSGKYSCQLSSTAGIDARAADMTIYSIPESISLNASYVEDIVNVVCTVEGVFPVPEIQIFHSEPGEMDAEEVKEVYMHHEEEEDAFDVFLMANISRSELDSGLHFFECLVTLEGTEYEEERRMPFRVHPISGGYRPGLRRKIHSEEGMLNPGNNPDDLHLEGFAFSNAVAEQPVHHPENDDDDDDDNGAFITRPSIAAILLFISVVLVLSW